MTTETLEQLSQRIADLYPCLSPRLRDAANYVLNHPADIALETLAVIARRSGVQPSTIVRLAKSLGFNGAAPMQRIFRDHLAAHHHEVSCSQLIADLGRQASTREQENPSRLLTECVARSARALDCLKKTISTRELRHATTLIGDCDWVYVAGFGRSYVVAAYVSLGLLRVGKRAVLVDEVGNLGTRQFEHATSSDLLFAISFEPYSPQIRRMLELANRRDIRTISITDSPHGPVAASSAAMFVVNDPKVRDFHLLTATMALAHTLVLGHVNESVST